VKSPAIKEVILTRVRDEGIESMLTSEKRTKIVGVTAFLALLTLAGMLVFWAFV
jgi:hypothetical protein